MKIYECDICGGDCNSLPIERKEYNAELLVWGDVPPEPHVWTAQTKYITLWRQTLFLV